MRVVEKRGAVKGFFDELFVNPQLAPKLELLLVALLKERMPLAN